MVKEMVKQRVNVKPSAKQARIIEEADGSLTVRLHSSPIDGKANQGKANQGKVNQGNANQALIRRLAKHFGVAKRAVLIRVGKPSRSKIVEILECSQPEG